MDINEHYNRVHSWQFVWLVRGPRGGRVALCLCRQCGIWWHNARRGAAPACYGPKWEPEGAEERWRDWWSRMAAQRRHRAAPHLRWYNRPRLPEPLYTLGQARALLEAGRRSRPAWG
jgi:hypothetical protein